MFIRDRRGFLKSCCLIFGLLICRVAVMPTEAQAADAADGKIRFQFNYHPWNEVLDWFAKQADLSLVMEAPPEGTFNYSDNSKEYTATEAIDLLNSVLLTKGYILVRREKMLMLIKSDEIPPNLVPIIPLDALDKRGEFDLVTVQFSLDKIPPSEVEEEIKKLTGPQGGVILLPKAGKIQVTETAGRLRSIRKVVEAMVKPPLPEDQKLHVFSLKNALAEQVLVLARQFMSIPEEGIEAPDGSIRIVIEQASNKLLVSGQKERIEQLAEIIRIVEQSGTTEAGSLVVETPQLEVYPIATAEPASVLAVLQTLLAGMPDVRLQIDPKTGSLVARARPQQHVTIRAVINQMQKDARQIEVIRLAMVDPQLAVLAINKLFGGGGDEASRTAPIVDAEPTTRRLLIRGTVGQIEQIRTLLRKMGETDAGDSEFAEVGKRSPRLIPLTGNAARTALEQVEAMWRRKNKIRVVRPSSPLESRDNSQSRDNRSSAPGGFSADEIDMLRDLLPDGLRRPPNGLPAQPLRQEPPAPMLDEGDEPAADKSATVPSSDSPSSGRVMRFVQNRTEPSDSPSQSKPKVEPKATGADIIVSITPGGIIIASDDTEALDHFEKLLNLMADMPVAPDFTVYYLKYEKVETAAEILGEIFGGGGSSSGGGDGGGLLGDLAGGMLGGMGGLLGPLLGGGGGGGGDLLSGGTVQFHPIPRLNAMIVQGSPTDVDTITELLKVIDQSQGPEDVEVKPRPRFIPVVNNPAESIAQVVRQVYQERISSGTNRSQQQPSPQQIMQMLRGGGRENRQRSQKNSRAEAEKMNVSVDPNSNSLIVTAADPLFQEVSMLVKQLDQTAAGSSEITKTVTLHDTSPQVIQRALAGILGDKVQSGNVSSPQKPNTTSSRTSSRPGFDRERANEGARRLMEFQEMMRRSNRGSTGSNSRRGGSSSGRSRTSPIPGRGGGR